MHGTLTESCEETASPAPNQLTAHAHYPINFRWGCGSIKLKIMAEGSASSSSVGTTRKRHRRAIECDHCGEMVSKSTTIGINN